MVRACSSNAESRWLRTVTQALSPGWAVTSAKYTSSSLTINSTPNTPRPPSALTIRAAIDFAASIAAGLIFCGCQDSSTRPPAPRCPIGEQNSIAGPAAPSLRTASSMTWNCTSTTVSASTRAPG